MAGVPLALLRVLLLLVPLLAQGGHQCPCGRNHLSEGDVCGSDGETYSSRCALECMRRSIADLTEEPCPDIPTWSPVEPTGRPYDFDSCRELCAQRFDFCLFMISDYRQTACAKGLCDCTCGCREFLGTRTSPPAVTPSSVARSWRPVRQCGVEEEASTPPCLIHNRAARCPVACRGHDGCVERCILASLDADCQCSSTSASVWSFQGQGHIAVLAGCVVASALRGRTQTT